MTQPDANTSNADDHVRSDADVNAVFSNTIPHPGVENTTLTALYVCLIFID